MDIIAHALWSAATGAVATKKVHQRIHLSWLVAWGVLPDLLVFTIPAATRVFRFLTGASKSLLPDGSGPHFDWVWGLYNATHSIFIFAACVAAIWLFTSNPPLEMLAWALHILIDVFTHGGLFAVKFLWPLSSVHFDGLRWETPWFLAVNYASLASFYLLLWIHRLNEKHSRHRSRPA